MSNLLPSLWQRLFGTGRRAAPTLAEPRPAAPLAAPPTVLDLDIAPTDPLAVYFQANAQPVELDKLNFESPALQRLKASGAKLVVPLVSQGELIGLINLGPRRSEQDYSADDRGLLSNLATQAAPAVRVAQLVRQQQLEAQERERMEQELRVARLIQQTLLPRELPALAGWQLSAYYQPARAVGGDFYDFVRFDDGRLALIIGDVTDKGVPAALVMATTRSILRSGAQRWAAPGRVLEYANDMLVGDIPPKMFVTCLFAVLEPATGRLVFANAGHDLPYRRHAGGVAEMRAVGMPLGLLPGMHYEEREVVLEPGDSVLLYSDGLVEAHNPAREMFGFPRLQACLGRHPGGAGLVDFLLAERARFVGPDWDQEDDTALVIVQREALPAGGWQTLASFDWPSEPGNERLAMEKVAEAVRQHAALPPGRLEKLKTAVAEATMNAMEHGNKFQPDVCVHFEVRASAGAVAVQITDQGGAPDRAAETPNLDAKLAGQQSPRGWGLFLIKNMVDEMHVTSDRHTHTVELVMRREESNRGD
ncbi:MAG: SpoIIE family protein phosphatase [Anaerolineales bacterium]|nr:SpoIIE family protein phosphatase [Anaerolineales bacterium]